MRAKSESEFAGGGERIPDQATVSVGLPLAVVALREGDPLFGLHARDQVRTRAEVEEAAYVPALILLERCAERARRGVSENGEVRAENLRAAETRSPARIVVAAERNREIEYRIFLGLVTVEDLPCAIARAPFVVGPRFPGARNSGAAR